MDIILEAFGNVLQLDSLLPTFIGVFLGIAIGAMPGLSVTMGVAVLFPLTFLFSGVGGILMLLGLYIGAVYGGSISAILLNTPGTPASVTTSMEGYPMTLRGEGDKALTISTLASFFGGIFSVTILIFLSPYLAGFAVSFSAPEYFSLAVFGLSIITAISSKSLVKGLIGMTIGLLISTIGVDAFSGYTRFTFGSLYLMDGISFVPVLIGLFAFSQLLISLGDSNENQHKSSKTLSFRRTLSHLRVFWEVKFALIRSSLIGTFIGAVPGAGGDVVTFISYNEAKRTARKDETFGTGNVRALASCESANNAVTGGAMVPLLTVGIPGDSVTAIILGAFMVQGLQPGPLLFKDHPVEIYTIFAGLLLANIIMFILGLAGVKFFSRIASVPRRYLTPLVFILCIIGSFSINNSFTDILVMIGFGVLGYYLIRHDYGVAPIVLGIILGPLLEANLRRSLILSQGDPWVFFERPISATFLLLMFLSLLTPVIKRFFIRYVRGNIHA